MAGWPLSMMPEEVPRLYAQRPLWRDVRVGEQNLLMSMHKTHNSDAFTERIHRTYSGIEKSITAFFTVVVEHDGLAGKGIDVRRLVLRVAAGDTVLRPAENGRRQQRV